ncbi:DUF625 domain protein [Aspergillus luchuensis]|uniref:DUF625 domain protein n=1 Tax=Aspergillus kawachii TaxID=1069201 RepID=A0A146FWG9_ASPKA|nr:DUF625 domain protein [Aspergillus luchuensis]
MSETTRPHRAYRGFNMCTSYKTHLLRLSPGQSASSPNVLTSSGSGSVIRQRIGRELVDRQGYVPCIFRSGSTHILLVLAGPPETEGSIISESPRLLLERIEKSIFHRNIASKTSVTWSSTCCIIAKAYIMQIVNCFDGVLGRSVFRKG